MVRRIGSGILAVAAVAVLAGCKVGVTDQVSTTHDTTAVLAGRAHADQTGALDAWFEYGPTAALGTSTAPTTVTVTAAPAYLPVSQRVVGLDEATTYHYRLCVQDAQGNGACGAVLQFTTGTGHDSVDGFGVVSEIPELGYYDGAQFDIVAGPDGSDPAGTASASPGSHYFRIPDEGPITCFRVSGNRAAIGFVADATEYDPSLPLIPRLVFVEDNGTTGDRILQSSPAEPVTSCPDPATMAATGGTVTRGDLVVHDHP